MDALLGTLVLPFEASSNSEQATIRNMSPTLRSHARHVCRKARTVFALGTTTAVVAITAAGIAAADPKADAPFMPAAVEEVLQKYYANGDVVETFGYPRIVIAGSGGAVQERAVSHWLTTRVAAAAKGSKAGGALVGRCDGSHCSLFDPLEPKSCPAAIYWTNADPTSASATTGCGKLYDASSKSGTSIIVIATSASHCGTSPFAQKAASRTNLPCFSIAAPDAAERRRFVRYTLDKLPAKRFGDLSANSVADLGDRVFAGLSFDQIALSFWGALAEAGAESSVALRHFEAASSNLFGETPSDQKHDEAVVASEKKTAAGGREEEKKRSGSREDALFKEYLPEALHWPPIVWGLFAFAAIAHFMTKYITGNTRNYKSPMSAKGGGKGGKLGMYGKGGLGMFDGKGGGLGGMEGLAGMGMGMGGMGVGPGPQSAFAGMMGGEGGGTGSGKGATTSDMNERQQQMLARMMMEAEKGGFMKNGVPDLDRFLNEFEDGGEEAAEGDAGIASSGVRNRGGGGKSPGGESGS
mmetsp:Transcript_23282/g.58891  ORF Transcript_23282/g.58891 Transcript_23282/m.58891 type:complete len:526 (+) Transcript_23282:10-1587(+)